jgi:hypothetical protein
LRRALQEACFQQLPNRCTQRVEASQTVWPSAQAAPSCLASPQEAVRGAAEEKRRKEKGEGRGREKKRKEEEEKKEQERGRRAKEEDKTVRRAFNFAPSPIIASPVQVSPTEFIPLARE